ncbi:MAG: hypothetical protein WEF50_08505 [Myxococcota bacterium]
MERTRSVLSLVFALALCIPGFARAEAIDDHAVVEPDVDDPVIDDPDDFHHASVPEQRLADKFGVDTSDIQSLRNEKLGYGEIDHTLTLAERLPGGITDENVATILEMRQDPKMGWGQIAHEQGTTLGQAKQDYPVQPPEEPPVTDPAQPAPAAMPQDSPTMQPKSLTRSGKTTIVSGGAPSQGGHGGKSLSRGGGSSNRSGKALTASSARSGHAYGRGGSGGSSLKSNGNGKAKGHK